MGVVRGRGRDRRQDATSTSSSSGSCSTASATSSGVCHSFLFCLGMIMVFSLLGKLRPVLVGSKSCCVGSPLGWCKSLLVIWTLRGYAATQSSLVDCTEPSCPTTLHSCIVQSTKRHTLVHSICACVNSACGWTRLPSPQNPSPPTAGSMRRTLHCGIRGRQTHTRPLVLDTSLCGNHAMRCSVLRPGCLYACATRLPFPLVICRFYRVSDSDYPIDALRDRRTNNRMHLNI